MLKVVKLPVRLLGKIKEAQFELTLIQGKLDCRICPVYKQLRVMCLTFSFLI